MNPVCRIRDLIVALYSRDNLESNGMSYVLQQHSDDDLGLGMEHLILRR